MRGTLIRRWAAVAACGAALVAAPVPASASPAGADGGCEVLSADDSEMDERAFTVVAHGEPTTGGIFMPVVQVVCAFYDGAFLIDRVDTGAYGPVAVAADAFVLPRQSYTVCVSVLAGWGPGDWYLNRYTCRTV